MGHVVREKGNIDTNQSNTVVTSWSFIIKLFKSKVSLFKKKVNRDEDVDEEEKKDEKKSFIIMLND